MLGAPATAVTVSGGVYVEWNVTSLLQAEYDAFTNNGFLIRDASEGGGGSEQQFHSREKGETMPELVITFGSAPGCDLVLSDRTVSRRHAKITVTGDQIFIQDLGSTNGTELNGERVERGKLADGDRITVGSTDVVFGRRLP